jgi:pimeloyl-ACP methyl ester carboxylesterase
MTMTDHATPDAIVRLESMAERRMVPAEGAELCWRRFGEGPVLVLLHGGHGSWLHWVRNIEALARRFEVWVPDMPGYGDSSAVPPPGGLDALVRATAASLDGLVGAATPVRLVGFSFGGLVATHLAAMRRGVVQLALLGSAGHGTPRRPNGKLRSWHAAAASGDPGALSEVMRHNLAVHMLHTPAHDIDPLALHLHTWSCLRTRFRSKEVAYAALIGPLLDALPAGLLLAWGEHDVTADPPMAVGSLAAGHASRQAMTIEGAGHWVQYQQADTVNAQLLGWLQP